MSELAKTYEPGAVEAKWYAYWLEHGCFQADPARVSEKRPAYSIVIPPPNVTGVLTLGHVLNNTIQDILARRARMLGKEVLWLPGTDHAGIATQNVVEKTLRKEGVMRHRDDLGREALVAKIWEWKEKYGGIIIQQLKKLGASCDWSRERFTMDPEYSKCVSRVFVELYKKGLIYRGKRMVNWCPVSLTALSDEEVVMKPQSGTMYYFKVEVIDRRDALPRVPTPSEEQGRAGAHPSEWIATGTWLTIATTRPETIPGDTAVAVNPKDTRYAHLIGKHVRRPLPIQIPDEQKLIPIIGDEHVDFAFGTGVLKVTPAHDKADFEIGQRHKLPVVDIMNPDGTMNALAGESLVGLDRFEARNVAAERLRELGALEKEEPYQNNVGYSERADVPIEPRLSEQWFLKYPSVAESQTCVADGRMKFFPDRWAKVYDHWLNGIQDWCISRQLWWGHRVPAWSGTIDERLLRIIPAGAFEKLGFQAKKGAELSDEESLEGFYKLDALIDSVDVSLSDIEGHTTTFRFPEEGGGVDEVRDRSFVFYAVTTSEKEAAVLEKAEWIQDTDVLDTWFSSWLWPFATMGWPEKTETLAKFYPTTDLVTGPDIIFFWVARMIMAGFEYMTPMVEERADRIGLEGNERERFVRENSMPFRNVYFTGIIRDKQGRKMSKSLGNSPDPLDLIAKYGADALRFGVMRSAPLGSDILFDEKNVELGRNFCTKLWNAARFRQMQGPATEGDPDKALLSSDDKWILLRLEAAIVEVSRALDEYRFSDATSVLYRFFWSEFCDWYLEASKATLNSPDEARKLNTLIVIDTVFIRTLRLMHPFLPFITEELWHDLGFAGEFPDDEGGLTVMQAPWPQPLGEMNEAAYGIVPSDERFAAAKYEVVNHGRALRRDFNIASNKRIRFVLKPNAPLPAHESEVLKILLNAEPFDVTADYTAPKGTPVALTPLGELFLPLEGLIDVAAERERLAKEIAKVEQELAKVRAKLADPNFTGKVPAKVLDEHRQREQDWAEKHAQLVKMREALGAA